MNVESGEFSWTWISIISPVRESIWVLFYRFILFSKPENTIRSNLGQLLRIKLLGGLVHEIAEFYQAFYHLNMLFFHDLVRLRVCLFAGKRWLTCLSCKAIQSCEKDNKALFNFL